MHKHYKLISGIACIVLCIAIIAFGVYAASTSLVKLNASVSFTPSTAKLTIFGGIAGSKESKETDGTSNYYATNYGDDESKHVNVQTESDANGAAIFNAWTYTSATFDDNYFETGKTHPDPIYFFVQITNHVERNIEIKIDFTNDYTDKNIKVSCLYELATNESLKEANVNNMYSISGTSAPMQSTTTALAGKSYKTLSSDVKYSTSEEVDFSSLNSQNSTTSLSTLMIVIKLEVKDADKNVENNTAFNFTISVK